jgi:hypothetical protein
MTTASVNVYAPHPLPTAANLLDTLERLPTAARQRRATTTEQPVDTPRAAWFGEGWEGAGYSPVAVIVELAALSVLLLAALFT